MIFDKKDNLAQYTGVHKDISAVIEFLNSHDMETLPLGKYPLVGESYVNVLEYEVGENELYEAHKKFIDLQYCIVGSEQILSQDVALVEVATPYSTDNDCLFGNATEGSRVALTSGTYGIYFPGDAHCPNLKFDSKTIKKAVFKLKI